MSHKYTVGRIVSDPTMNCGARITGYDGISSDGQPLYKIRRDGPSSRHRDKSRLVATLPESELEVTGMEISATAWTGRPEHKPDWLSFLIISSP